MFSGVWSVFQWLLSYYHRLPVILRDVQQVYRDRGLRGAREWFASKWLEWHCWRVWSEEDRQAGYGAWVSRFDTLGEQDLERIDAQIRSFERRPRISIIVPVYNTPERWLTRALDSVLAQRYPDWELCIADDASTQGHVRPLLESYARRDSRIKVVFRDRNGHISAASNSALELATGEFMGLLDHDDELTVHALYMVAHELNRFPDADIVYSDEDKIDEKNVRVEPRFKPDWNPDLLHTNNYVCHFMVCRTALVRKVGGFRTGLEGAQDFDLCLRCAAETSAPRIRHIPFILYHWRAIPGSTACGPSEKGYTSDAGRTAVVDYFAAAKADVRVEHGRLPNTYRVRYPIGASPPKVSLIIPTRDGYGILKQCIGSIREKSTYPSYEIVIVDNQSTDPRTLEYMAAAAQQANVRLLRYDHPFNYAAINNFAVSQTSSEIVGFVNNDVEVIAPEWLDEMVGHARRSEIGLVGARLLYPDGTLQHGGVILGLGGIAGHYQANLPGKAPGYMGRALLTQNLSAVTAACALVRRSVFDEVGGFDAENLPVAFNDVDLCLRVRSAGYRNLWTPYAELFHHESASRGEDTTPEKQARWSREVDYMRRRWGQALREDPYYSPNLTIVSEDCAFGFPPRRLVPWIEAPRDAPASDPMRDA